MEDFGIDFVLGLDLPDIRRYHGPRGTYYTDCPFCGKKRKVGIDPAKGIGRCNYCGVGFNKISLHAMLKGISNLEAGRELTALYRDLSEEEREKYALKTAGTADRETAPAPLDERDEVYRELLGRLTLSEAHRESLYRRGLTDSQIEMLMYRSFPGERLGRVEKEMSAFLRERVTGREGVPGFWRTRYGNVHIVRRRSGILLPVRTDTGMISGLQIRYDNLPENASEAERDAWRKYAWFSSSEKKGGCPVSGCENIHFAGNWNAMPETVTITEGVLKADIAAALSGGRFLGLTGVNNTSQLPGVLACLKGYGGTETVNVAVDVDCRGKPQVAAALGEICRMVDEAGFRRRIITWDERWKGVDDFLLARKELLNACSGE